MAVTDTEVFQEVAYRYWSQRKWTVAVQVLKDYESIFNEILPIEKRHLQEYYSLLNNYSFLSPRDAIHIAVMKLHDLKYVYTTDQAFEKLPFIEVVPLL